MIKKVLFNNILKFNQKGQIYFQQTFRAKIFFIFYKILIISDSINKTL